jgi:hypothetical protein
VRFDSAYFERIAQVPLILEPARSGGDVDVAIGYLTKGREVIDNRCVTTLSTARMPH